MTVVFGNSFEEDVRENLFSLFKGTLIPDLSFLLHLFRFLNYNFSKAIMERYSNYCSIFIVAVVFSVVLAIPTGDNVCMKEVK